MPRPISGACRLLLAMSFVATALLAHHSFGAEYDATKPVTLRGVITKIDWTNPHSYFFIDVKDDKGDVANRKLEGYPPSVLSKLWILHSSLMLRGGTRIQRTTTNSS
jgi:hypothetical protein